MPPRPARHGASAWQTARDLEEELFVLITLGDERNVVATYVMGERVNAPSFSGGALGSDRRSAQA
jgi:guanine deaminase